MPLSYEVRLQLRKNRKGAVHEKHCGYCGEPFMTPYPSKLYHTVCTRLMNIERARKRNGEIIMSGKGDKRRKEDTKKVRDNWDNIFKPKPKKEPSQHSGDELNH